MIARPSPLDRYKSFFEQYSVRLSASQYNQIHRYLDELLQWNKAFNLTGLYSMDEVIRHLLLDSLICAANLPKSGMLLDVGSGAGFPAIPVKIYSPGLHMYLLEPNRKKANFLKHMKRVLSLRGLEVSRHRLEERQVSNGGMYDVITARGVMGPADLLRVAGHLLRDRGVVALFLGKDTNKIMSVFEGRAKEAGLRLRQQLEYTLPGLKTSRTLCFFERVGKRLLTS